MLSFHRFIPSRFMLPRSPFRGCLLFPMQYSSNFRNTKQFPHVQPSMGKPVFQHVELFRIQEGYPDPFQQLRIDLPPPMMIILMWRWSCSQPFCCSNSTRIDVFFISKIPFKLSTSFCFSNGLFWTVFCGNATLSFAGGTLFLWEITSVVFGVLPFFIRIIVGNRVLVGVSLLEGWESLELTYMGLWKEKKEIVLLKDLYQQDWNKEKEMFYFNIKNRYMFYVLLLSGASYNGKFLKNIASRKNLNSIFSNDVGK
eukprot:TRINITY_DN2798_c0_g3_i2.p1 TRINITY_DN2798_c0_g3~~TRINITY_DN2798_c0_g3_i2.p1  ORF type:complete len:255 (-),score=29.11 TRINITY_DN2798_c0_g3_i2:71-835(-)